MTDPITRINQHYAVVIQAGSLYILQEYGPKLISKDSFLALLAKDKTRVKTRRGSRVYPTALLWLASPERRQYIGAGKGSGVFP